MMITIYLGARAYEVEFNYLPNEPDAGPEANPTEVKLVGSGMVSFDEFVCTYAKFMDIEMSTAEEEIYEMMVTYGEKQWGKRS